MPDPRMDNLRPAGDDVLDRLAPELRQQLVARIVANVTIDEITGCWLRRAHKGSGGYARIQINRRMYYAHRIMLENKIGDLPPNTVTDHLCHVRCCVNPDHLEAVTQVINVRRGKSLCAKNAQKTHCDAGHPLDGENLRIRRNGNRTCIACNRVSVKKYRLSLAANRSAPST